MSATHFVNMFDPRYSFSGSDNSKILILQGIWSGMLGGTLMQTLILIWVTARTDWDKEVICIVPISLLKEIFNNNQIFVMVYTNKLILSIFA